MKTAIIIHGMPTKEDYFSINGDAESNCQWIPWLQKRLISNGILAQTPEMPQPYEPRYEEWKKLFERFTIDEETTLVGHSCGGGFLVRWLSENDINVGKVVLVAPWIDMEHTLTTGMFDFEIDQDLTNRTKGVTLFYSNDDDSDILSTFQKLKSTIHHLMIREFSDRGHFTLGDMGTREFPELLETILE